MTGFRWYSFPHKINIGSICSVDLCKYIVFQPTYCKEDKKSNFNLERREGGKTEIMEK